MSICYSLYIFLFIAAALVLHQNSKLKKLQEDLKAACDYCEELKKKVALKEKQVLERRKCRSGPRTTISVRSLLHHIYVLDGGGTLVQSKVLILHNQLVKLILL